MKTARQRKSLKSAGIQGLKQLFNNSIIQGVDLWVVCNTIPARDLFSPRKFHHHLLRGVTFNSMPLTMVSIYLQGWINTCQSHTEHKFTSIHRHWNGFYYSLKVARLVTRTTVDTGNVLSIIAWDDHIVRCHSGQQLLNLAAVSNVTSEERFCHYNLIGYLDNAKANYIITSLFLHRLYWYRCDICTGNSWDDVTPVVNNTNHLQRLTNRAKHLILSIVIFLNQNP